MPYVLTTCPFCGCGCGLYLQVEGGRALGTVASADHPVARGRLCAKGWHAHEVAASPRRVLSPLIRRQGVLEETGWDEALDFTATRLRSIQEAEGGTAVGFLGSPRGTNEENYLLAKVARLCFGTNNVDFSARLDALPSLFDLPKYRRFTLPTGNIKDIEQADLIVLWQTDPVEEHPAAAARVLHAAENGVPLLEVAIRSAQLGMRAKVRLWPIPGTEAQLAAGLLRATLHEMNPTRPARETLAATVDGWTPEKTEQVTGVLAEDIVRVGQRLAEARRPLIVYSRGMTLAGQGGECLMGLAALRQEVVGEGNEWQPLLWLTKHCNAQGARDVGVVPYFLPGYQDVGDERARANVAQVWGAAPPAEAGLSAWDMVKRVRGLYVMGDDPLRLLPGGDGTRLEFENIEFLVVQDSFLTPTAAAADVVLPGATFAEKDGTFTSTERRVQRVRRAADAPPDIRTELEVLCSLAERFGHPMDYGSVAEVMDEIASISPIYQGLSYEALDQSWGFQWSIDTVLGDSRRLDSMVGENAQDPTLAERNAVPRIDEEFPLVLVVDYGIEAWSDDSFVANAIGLRREKGANRKSDLERAVISATDADKLDLRSGVRVRIRSRNGQAQVLLGVSDRVRAGVVLAPASMGGALNGLVPCETDPESGVPRLMPCAVCIEKP